MSGDTQLLLMIVGMHILALVCAAVLLLPALKDVQEVPPRPPDSGSDDGWGRWPTPPRRPSSPRGGVPLPDAEPARVRLRDHGRLADQIPRPERRPAREPDRQPAREPERRTTRRS